MQSYWDCLPKEIQKYIYRLSQIDSNISTELNNCGNYYQWNYRGGYHNRSCKTFIWECEQKPEDPDKCILQMGWRWTKPKKILVIDCQGRVIPYKKIFEDEDTYTIETKFDSSNWKIQRNPKIKYWLKPQQECICGRTKHVKKCLDYNFGYKYYVREVWIYPKGIKLI